MQQGKLECEKYLAFVLVLHYYATRLAYKRLRHFVIQSAVKLKPCCGSLTYFIPRFRLSRWLQCLLWFARWLLVLVYDTRLKIALISFDDIFFLYIMCMQFLLPYLIASFRHHLVTCQMRQDKSCFVFCRDAVEPKHR